jgi:hypothetical protein
VSDGTTDNGLVVATVCKGLPGKGSEAAVNPVAKTWEAADGCYVPFRIETGDNHYQVQTAKQLVLTGVNNPECLATAFIISASNGAVPLGPIRKANIEPSCAYFTGLHPDSVLSVSSIIVVESAPVTDSSELSLVSMAAPYDPEVLAIYRNAICRLPPGVPVSMNPEGEFWKMVLKVIVEVAPVVAPLLSLAPVVGPGLSLAASAGGAWANSRIKQFEEKKANEDKKSAPMTRKNTIQASNQAGKPKPKSKAMPKKRN